VSPGHALLKRGAPEAQVAQAGPGEGARTLTFTLTAPPPPGHWRMGTKRRRHPPKGYAGNLDDAGGIRRVDAGASALHLLKGDWAKALSRIELWVAVARTGNFLFHLPWGIASSAWPLAQLGEASEALNRLRESEPLLERLPASRILASLAWFITRWRAPVCCSAGATRRGVSATARCSRSIGMSQTCQQRTHAQQQIASSFDHLVGTGEQRRR
jgi:hypothetical protein